MTQGPRRGRSRRPLRACSRLSGVPGKWLKRGGEGGGERKREGGGERERERERASEIHTERERGSEGEIERETESAKARARESERGGRSKPPGSSAPGQRVQFPFFSRILVDLVIHDSEKVSLEHLLLSYYPSARGPTSVWSLNA